MNARTTNQVASSSTAAPPNPLADNTVDNVLNAGAILTAVMREAAETLQNVPYVKTLSGVVLQILKIKDEIKHNKARCTEIINKVGRLAQWIYKELKKVGELKGRERADWEAIETCLETCEKTFDAVLATLKAHNSRKWHKKLLSRETQELDAVERSVDSLWDILKMDFISDIKTIQGKLIRSISERESFKLLYKNVAVAALHDSARRKDCCHPSTRVDILKDIFDWILQSADRDKWILWLNGAAGAGKSAIMQSLAEDCTAQFIALATFFFLRGDSFRDSVARLFATLAYQLMLLIPETSEGILHVIEHDPLIFGKALEYQLNELLIQPLLHLPTHLQRLLVIFIDGLDECDSRDDQATLIKLLGAVSRERNVPLLFLVASRREPQIEAAFRQKLTSDLLKTIALDTSDIEQTSDDIHRFLNDKFSEIRTSHPFAHLLVPGWPSNDIVDKIVEKASGQFIYASVVIKYVSAPNRNPESRLDAIHDINLRSLLTHNPFASLDSLYQYIFSQVPKEHLSKACDALAFRLILPGPYALGVFDAEPGEALEVIFADLTAIVHLEHDRNRIPEIRFLHASLHDFLQDQSRSGEYFLDLKKYTTKLLIQFLERKYLDPLSEGYDLNVVAKQEYWWLLAIRQFFERATASQKLQQAVMKFDLAFHSVQLYYKEQNLYNLVHILEYLEKLNFGDEGKAYAHLLEMLAQGYAKFWTEHSDNIKLWIRGSRDLCARIREIRPDLADDPLLGPK